jgi:hypothetical protein
MPYPALPTRVTCPKCGAHFIIQLQTVLDVGEDPTLKEKVLQGQINYAQCPQCQSGGMLNSPLLYHDPQKELLVSYMPAELALSAQQQEQYLGGLVAAVMNAQPPDKRKAYFFQPKTVLTLDGLYDLILEGEGISPEALAAQRTRLALISQLLPLATDPPALDKAIAEHRAELDYEFFLILSEVIENNEREGDPARAQALTELRTKLLEKVTPAMPPAAAAPTVAQNYEELLTLLQSTPAGREWRVAVALNRARLDYGFFQALTGKIEAAQAANDQDTAQKLSELRQRILDELDAQTKLVRQAEDKASLFIMELMEAADPAALLRGRKAEINDVLIGMLSRYGEAAQVGNNTARAEKMAALLELTIQALEDELPPDVRLVNKLLRSERPDGTNAVLEEHRGLLSDAFLATLDGYITELGQGPDKDLAEHLRAVRAQVVAKMTIARM